ncbi:MAG: alpha-mannosidase [Limnochordaceae bacterium]|nr:alpha-mannosidase [Limnochordaceae bacterium]
MELQLLPRKVDRRLQEIERYQYRDRRDLSPWLFKEGWLGTGAAAWNLDESGWERLELGQEWGGRDVTVWFRRTVTIPPEWSSEGGRYALLFRAGGEALVYFQGIPLQGVDAWHKEVLLSDRLQPGATAQLAVEAWSGMGGELHRLEETALVWIDEPVRQFAQDGRAVWLIAQALPQDDPLRAALLRAVDAAVDSVDYLHKGSDRFRESLIHASQQLRAAVERIRQQYPTRGELHVIGHAHIDTAWLWPIRETHRKAARTFSTALHLMEQYPAYYFGQSQPQLYAWIKQEHPHIYEGIRRRVAQGRWEPLGALWVESDCNLPSGESLVRQVVHGKRFFRKEFGYDSRVAWLPDAFGFSWGLPQILKKAGVDYFVTTKISWNQFNRFPYDLFWWEGADGSRVLAHFYHNPEGGYNGQILPSQLKGTWDRFQQKDVSPACLFTFGFGDGGGGPTYEMLEMQERLGRAPGLPLLHTGPVQPFLDHLPRPADLPVWNDELYLELHRGTFTTQAAVKRGNRLTEFALRRAEMLASWASLVAGEPYPAAELDEAWKTLLRNQFHDILPGSGIHEIYEDAIRELTEARQVAARVIRQATQALTRSLVAAAPAPASTPAPPDGGTTLADRLPAFVVWNDLSWDRQDLVRYPVAREELESWQRDGRRLWVINPAGERLACQVVDEGDTDDQVALLFPARGVPSCGYGLFQLEAACEPAGGVSVPATEELVAERRDSGWEIRTPFYEISLDRVGAIRRLFDRQAGREVLLPGRRGNVLQAFEDKPNMWDAWDIDLFYQKKGWEVQENASVELVESGPLRLTLRISREFEHSRVVQQMRLYRDLRRIDFDTEIDWHEREVLLKVAFPVAVRARQATYEIAYGHIERPTYANTSWERARFEVVGHKWVDLSEDGYGVSLLNDGKYGHDIHDSTIRLTLLKSPVSPDPRADEGRQHFTYSLLPHSGDWRQAQTVARAYELNAPAYVERFDGFTGVESQPSDPAQRQAGPARQHSFLVVTAPNVVTEVWKAPDELADRVQTGARIAGQAASGQGTEWIIRLYEAFGRRGPVQLQFDRQVEAAQLVNLMEEPQWVEPAGAPSVCGRTVTVQLQPGEILTLRVRFGDVA